MVMNRVQGQILGKTYTLSTSENEAHMQAVFKLANTQLIDLQQQNAQLNQNDALVLIALNALSDQLSMQHKYEEN
ncbi:cell division protein ZapA [Weissella coleopterorum]|uniref:Cell division protein ZapA n=1 Tax=Weissella coleopterorum TaxID=2714949 RepID=A0A6G8B142_9LACO|nr:cell division protein ZapA [Weissella coleopterorum]QIL50942.1 cell division protein ZapA [Weissella coleopterorum]